ncbi:ribonuclease M5 [Alkalicoccobacillus plakortidis]|uniref:Ribonuclease M5 n=1 Tax=Alkalicoccobacillus plakortidis TaxID=444060 RepID=A0ABT0XKS6_9BACI|nr:ribonuclease M5 [Alkalicoccobacillus plakortidis]MCM2676501.1 ribonuclease M5 [Alkalicoccobacillus plakortidis]
MKIKEVIVVEGRDDTTAIQRAVDADTIETNGSAIGESVLARIALAKQRRGIIILTDPDYPGERIRRVVSQHVPGCKHAFLPKHAAISKKGDDLGVENASPEAIRLALSSVQEEAVEAPAQILWEDLHAAGLVAGEHAKRRREQLGEKLSIGYANGKQLLKRLHIFQIQPEEFREALILVLKEEQQHD